jgi:hypothetical protein
MSKYQKSTFSTQAIVGIVILIVLIVALVGIVIWQVVASRNQVAFEVGSPSVVQAKKTAAKEAYRRVSMSTDDEERKLSQGDGHSTGEPDEAPPKAARKHRQKKVDSH